MHHLRFGQRLSRRQVLNLIGGMVSTVLVAACTPSGNAPAEGNGEVGAPGPQTQEVIFWGHEQHPLDLAAEGFVEAHPEINWISPHPVDWVDKLQIAMASDSGCPDLVWAEVLQAQDWGCSALLTDLTDVLSPIVDAYHPLKVNETLIAKTGRNVGWPGDISVSGWYYNANKLAEVGYGGVDFESYTWDDFYIMAADLKSQNLYAFAFPADGWSPLYMFVLHQLGGTAVSQDGQQIMIGSDEGMRAMQIVKNLWDAGGLDVEWWSSAYWAALKEGQLVGDFAAAWARGFWEAQLADAADAPETSMWRVAKFPGGDGIKYRTGVWLGWQLVNPKAGINDANALNFMQYALGSIEGAALCGQWGIVPAYRPYLEAQEFLQLRSPIFGDWPFGELWAGQEKELSTEFYRPAGWGAVEAAIGKEMVPILREELSVEDGMARIIELATPDFERTRCS